MTDTKQICDAINALPDDALGARNRMFKASDLKARSGVRSRCWRRRYRFTLMNGIGIGHITERSQRSDGLKVLL
jgi:hypothetical protein